MTATPAAIALVDAYRDALLAEAPDGTYESRYAARQTTRARLIAALNGVTLAPLGAAPADLGALVAAAARLHAEAACERVLAACAECGHDASWHNVGPAACPQCGGPVRRVTEPSAVRGFVEQTVPAGVPTPSAMAIPFLTPAQEIVWREIEGRATFYHGQEGADVDWLLAQVRRARLAVHGGPVLPEGATCQYCGGLGWFYNTEDDAKVGFKTACRHEPAEGPWRVMEVFGGSRPEWRVTDGTRTYAPFDFKVEALAVRDALNRLAVDGGPVLPEGDRAALPWGDFTTELDLDTWNVVVRMQRPADPKQFLEWVTAALNRAALNGLRAGRTETP